MMKRGQFLRGKRSVAAGRAAQPQHARLLSGAPVCSSRDASWEALRLDSRAPPPSLRSCEKIEKPSSPRPSPPSEGGEGEDARGNFFTASEALLCEAVPSLSVPRRPQSANSRRYHSVQALAR